MAFGETPHTPYRRQGATVAERPKNCAGAPELALVIVEYAIKDWRYLVKKKAWNKEGWLPNIPELRRFFQSEWCEFLLNDFGVTPERILAILEQELQTAMEKDAQEKRISARKKRQVRR